MILSYEDLPRWADKVALVDGCFDPLHVGHVRYFEEAAKLGMPLVCNVQGDRYIQETKKRKTLLPEDQRIALIHSLKPIEHVHLCKTSTHDVLKTLKPKKYIKGMDWKNRNLPQVEQEICKQFGIEIEYLDTNLDTSTNRVNEFMKQGKPDFRAQVAEFERITLAQGIVPSNSYDSKYFMGDWRAGENDYSLERRREIEGKNPQNIKDIFQPKTVLDLGCGPGALMYLMHELGLETYGVDFSADAKKLAHKDVRDRIHVGSVTDYHDFGVDFDLVVCRELLEHLTVMQVRQAVQVMARYTKKFLYITTRYHQSPEHFLDVSDDKKTDPTHITVLNKEFMRALFILEGLKSRPDLEDRLDWKKLGRVLCFEKVNF